MSTVLDDLINPNPMKIEVPYYDDLSRVSNSALGYFIDSVKRFHDMLNGKGKSIEGKFLIDGQAIHKYLLEFEDFWKEFKIQSAVQPASANQKKFAELMVKYTHDKVPFDTAKLNAYKEAYSTKNKSEEALILESSKLYTELDDYIESLSSKDNRQDISFNLLNNIKLIEANIKNHPLAKDLVYPDLSQYKVYSELHINWLHKVSQIDCKSLIDRLIIDHDNKTIKLVDLKTTAHIVNFKHSMTEYGYFRQIAFYKMAIEWWFENVLNLKFNEYKFDAYIVAISTNSLTLNEVRVFNIDENHILEYTNLINDLLFELQWHFDNDKWEYSRDCYLTGLDNLDNKWKQLDNRI